MVHRDNHGTGSEEEKLKAFREVRDQIKARIKAWLDNPQLGLKA